MSMLINELKMKKINSSHINKIKSHNIQKKVKNTLKVGSNKILIAIHH